MGNKLDQGWATGGPRSESSRTGNPIFIDLLKLLFLTLFLTVCVYFLIHF